MHAHQVDKDDRPVTVVVTRIAKRDKIREFEEWMDGIIHEAMKFEGHMGVNVIRPSDLKFLPTSLLHIIVIVSCWPSIRQSCQPNRCGGTFFN
jgi:hypothetical protein